MSPEPGFTMQELLQQVFALEAPLGESITTKEFMDLSGVGSMKTARSRLRPLVEAGILLPTRRKAKNMAGFMSSVPAYAINPAKAWDDVLGLE